MRDKNLLAAKDISKSFGQTKALCNVDIDVKCGEIHGLIGENGSGKSTFSSIVTGIHRADGGSLLFDGKPFSPVNRLASTAAGVSILVQEQETIGELSVAANLFIGKENLFVRHGMMNLRRMNREAKKVLQAIGITRIPSDAMANTLSFEDRKLVEIARAMSSAPKLLIVDETSTALTLKGREILYAVMRKMRENNHSVLLISHDMDEIMSFSDSLTILRDGCVTATLSKKDFDQNQIRELMVGRKIAENFYRADYDATWKKKVVLHADRISGGQLKDFSFHLHQGEILGIGGLTDCGIHDVGRLAFGLMKCTSGSVGSEHCKNISSAVTAVQNGIGYVSKNRDREALMPTASIKDNICLPSLKELAVHGFIGKKTEEKFAEEWADRLETKMNSVNQPCSFLSGGNKQKVVLSKWLGKSSDILILDCPTRGIDIGVKSLIYKLMMELKQQGKSILMISEELPELIGMSDRILILKDGVKAGEFNRSKNLTESELIKYMI